MGQKYTCEGSVRDDCGVMHRSLAAAVACVRRDQRDCSSQGGYSDRRIMRVTERGLVRLSEAEADEAEE